MRFDRKVNFVTRTSGDGYWSVQIKNVRITRVELAYVNKECDFGELRAYFDTGDWDIDNDGLIYSDMGWKHSFLTCMENHFGLSPDAILDLSYSEQGMQGEDYVSMDVGPQFILECSALYRFVVYQEAVFQGA